MDELKSVYERSIENDNLFHLKRFEDSPPSKSYLSGFFDGDGCIYIRKQSEHGYTTGLSIAQCRTNILHILRYHYGGTISPEHRNHQQVGEKIEIEQLSEGNLQIKNGSLEDITTGLLSVKQKRNIFCYLNSQPSYRFLLNDIKDHIICKYIQANTLYAFQKYVNREYVEEKELLFQEVNQANSRIIRPEYDISRLNIEYIAGLFDAEGYIYIKKMKSTKHYSGGIYVKITQKNHPKILYAIKDFMKYGNVCDDLFYHIDTFEPIYDFLTKILPYTIVKYNQILATIAYIDSSKLMIHKKYTDEVHSIREMCYKILNKEKHLNEDDEHIMDYGISKFTEREEEEKMRKMEAQKAHIKEVYAQKSENMKGEKNHNYGKEKSMEIKHKMSISHKMKRKSIPDEIILKIRKEIEDGEKCVDIEKKYELSRNQVYKIKKGSISTIEEMKSLEYYESIKNKPTMSTEEQAIHKRKVSVDEIFFILEEYLKKSSKASKENGPKQIFERVCARRVENGVLDELTFHSIKNVIDRKTIIYSSEVDSAKYTYYQELLQKIKDRT